MVAKTPDDNIHDEQAQEMNKDPDRTDLDSITDHELLKMLLNYSVPRAETNDVVDNIMDEFSTLNNLFGVDNDYLMSIEGVERKSADLIKLCYTFMRRCEMQRINPKENIKSFKNVDDVRTFLASHFALLKEERLGMLLLDASHRMIDFRFVASGNANMVKIDNVKLILIARMLGTSYVYLAHNHPFSTAQPSPEDIRFTLSIQEQLAEESIYLIDHFIFAGDECTSIFDNKNK